MQAIKILCFILGLFEFFSVYQLNTLDENKLIVEHAKVLPSFVIRDSSAKIIYCGFLLMLGLQRLTWATVNGTTSLYSWIVLILTHTIECFIWYSLALDVNRYETLQSLIMKTITFELGLFPLLVLVGVPLLVLVFTVCGLIDLTTKKSKYSKRS